MINDPISLCQDFVRIPSLSGQERALMERVQSTMQDLGYDEIWQDEYGHTVGVLKGSKPGAGRRLLVDIHADTVEVTSPESWQREPFGGQLVEGKIYGRGACDIKSGLASALVGLASLPRGSYNGDIWVAATVVEEMMEGAATRFVLEQAACRGGQPDFCVVVEPTQLKAGLAQKGRAGIRLQTSGIPAHTSMAELGENAVYKMLPAIQKVREMPKRSDPVLGSEIFELVEIVSEPFPGNSIVPDGCRARLDCRLMVSETEESLLERFRKQLTADVQVDLWPVRIDLFTGKRLEQPDFHHAWAASREDPLPAALLQALEATGLPAETYTVPYCCNASAVTEQGIPVVVFGPGDIGQAHTVDEWVTAGELDHAAQVYAKLAELLLRSD
jgi:putative selenium metabolism hydrolase